MRIVVQRVKEAKVTIEDRTVGSIGKGLLLLIGVGQDDTKELTDRYIDKIIKLRIFADEQGKTNLSLQDVGGEVLVVSQFTLYADCKKGNRPSFTSAADPKKANELYEYFLIAIKERLGNVEKGEFGADMQVSLVNDGPFTVILGEELVF
ncbi:MAG: hypothetical protein K0S47_1645 [Herbinix sp.]|jgi:D-tyrosyl-tRNA(Tyr) deacylase|nr:hypothetical protein [Herbinix sp.]